MNARRPWRRRLRRTRDALLASPYRGAWLLTMVAASSAVVAMCAYMIVPIEPFGYYKDLGFDHEITAWAASTVRSPIDFVDTLGWAPWNGTALFYLSSYVCHLVSVPISVAVGNAWLAIKIVQVLQVFVACLGAVAMYATMRRSPFWSVTFGVLYAALPTTELAIRGNMELGWIAALMPGTFAVGRLLIRRYGDRAIPFVGALCGFTAGVIALEYFLFVSLPVFALVVLSERPRMRREAIWLVPLGALCCAAIGAFFLLPTFVHPLFTDAAVRTATLTSGAFLDNFSESWVGMLALVPRESLVSPIADFNATDSLPMLYLAGVLCWAGALAFVATTRSSRTLTDPLSLVLVGACAILALGTTFPLGRTLWQALFLVPHLDAIRTTDRFLAVPAMMVALWFVLEVQTLAARFVKRRAILAYAVLVASLSAIAFDATQHCFSVDPSKGARLPQLDAVGSVVAKLGGRTASFAGVDGGSSNDAPDYGLPQPISAAYLDLGGRFFQDGLGAAGVLGRMGVHSVITAPNWTYDTPDVPPSSNIYRHVLASRAAFISGEDVRVFQIVGRPMVAPVRIVCTLGGPGGFDALDLRLALANVAYAEPGARCAANAYVNFDPLDAWRERHPIDSWAGAEVLSSATRLRDHDYPYLPNRVLLDVPWYRNAVDGRRPVFDPGGAVRLEKAASIDLPVHRRWPSGTTVAVRFSARERGRVTLAFAGRSMALPFAAGEGFRWVSFRVDRVVAATTSVRLTFERTDRSELPDTDAALDGIVALPARTAYDPTLPVGLVAMTIPQPTLGDVDRAPSRSTDTGLSLVDTDAMHIDHVGDDEALIADGPDAGARYRWNGPDGTYEIRALAVLETRDATVSIDANGGRGCCAVRSIPGESGRFSSTFERLTLRRGSIVKLRLSLPHFDRGSADRVMDVTAIARSALRIGPGSRSSNVDFSNASSALAEIATARAIGLTKEGAIGAPGSSIDFDVSADRAYTNFSLSIERHGDGVGTISLRCGRTARSITSTPYPSTVTAIELKPGTCHGRVTWTVGTFTVERVVVSVAGDDNARRRLRFWVPAGSYRPDITAADGRPLRTTIEAAGCSFARCSFANDGYHTIAVALPPNATGGTIVFRRSDHDGGTSRVRVDVDSALRWTIAMERPGAVELAQLYDGNWRATGNGTSIVGERCDITNTCFADLAPGTYRISHRWPDSLRIGIGISLFIIAGTTIVMLFPRRFARPA